MRGVKISINGSNNQNQSRMTVQMAFHYYRSIHCLILHCFVNHKTMLPVGLHKNFMKLFYCRVQFVRETQTIVHRQHCFLIKEQLRFVRNKRIKYGSDSKVPRNGESGPQYLKDSGENERNHMPQRFSTLTNSSRLLSPQTKSWRIPLTAGAISWICLSSLIRWSDSRRVLSPSELPQAIVSSHARFDWPYQEISIISRTRETLTFLQEQHSWIVADWFEATNGRVQDADCFLKVNWIRCWPKAIVTSDKLLFAWILFALFLFLG
jgi:hypothetical protein